MHRHLWHQSTGESFISLTQDFESPNNKLFFFLFFISLSLSFFPQGQTACQFTFANRKIFKMIHKNIFPCYFLTYLTIQNRKIRFRCGLGENSGCLQCCQPLLSDPHQEKRCLPLGPTLSCSNVMLGLKTHFKETCIRKTLTSMRLFSRCLRWRRAVECRTHRDRASPWSWPSFNVFFSLDTGN